MSNQLNPSVTDPTIGNLYGKIKKGEIILAPDFQRKFVWTQKHQESFIDTILKGLPFPEIYISEGETDLDDLTTKQFVIDGQQRLATIRNYIEDKFDRPLKNVCTFNNLSEVEKKNFVGYKVIVRNLGEIEEEKVREIFRRINLTKFKLNDVEIHNAIYDGLYITTAKELAAEIDLSKYDVFYESEFTRMADIYFILLVMSTIDTGGYFTRDKEIEANVSLYNEKYENQENTRAKILKAFKTVDSLRLGADSIWFRKSNFFTMVVELSKAKKYPKDIEERLKKLDASIMQHKGNSKHKLGQYYNYMYTGTNQRKARVVRSDIFKEHVLES